MDTARCLDTSTAIVLPRLFTQHKANHHRHTRDHIQRALNGRLSVARPNAETRQHSSSGEIGTALEAKLTWRRRNPAAQHLHNSRSLPPVHSLCWRQQQLKLSQHHRKQQHQQQLESANLRCCKQQRCQFLNRKQQLQQQDYHLQQGRMQHLTSSPLLAQSLPWLGSRSLARVCGCVCSWPWEGPA